MRENRIDKTVPENWWKLSEVNAVALSKLFWDEKLEVMLNADHTFVYFYPEKYVVVAHKNKNRVGGRVKSDANAGFTAMVTVNLGTIQMDAPFVVYNGTKLKDSKNPQSTLVYRYRHWRDLSIGSSGHMYFQRKYWFDDDITIEYLDFLLDVVHTGKKVGLSIDMTPVHRSWRVSEYIEKRTNEGRLVLGFINCGLDSVLQVCDLVSNKESKSLIKKAQMKWRA